MLLPRIMETALRFYSRLTPTDRGNLRLAHLVRALRPAERWRDVFHTPQGLTLELDLATYPDCCMAFGLYETTTARLIGRMLRTGDHFVDAGANLGYFTLLAAKRVGPAGRVDTIEPQPDNRARLEYHLRCNGSPPQVVVHPVALADTSGTVTIHAYPPGDAHHNHGCASLFPEPGARTTGVKVPGVTLDDLLAGAQPRLIKMDLEGAEVLAVRGMRRLVTGPNPPMLIVEYNPPQARTAGFEPDAWMRLLLEMQPNYRIDIIDWRLRRIALNPPRQVPDRQVNLLLRCGPV